MNYLQPLNLSKTQEHLKQNTQKNPAGVRQNNTGVSQPSVPRSSGNEVQNVEMIQAWLSGGSVEMPKSRVAPKNAGSKMDFLG
jgi:hypothetical protein